jgi:RNA-binding protein 25
MRSWVLKKMVEYLGEEEPTLTDFILSKLQKRCQPHELLTELSAGTVHIVGAVRRRNE